MSILVLDVNCQTSAMMDDTFASITLAMDTGLRKFGAILGEGVQIGCNAVCNPGTVLGLNCNVWPNVTVSGAHESGSTLRE